MAERQYAATHEWVTLKGNVATVGISEYAVEQLGDVVYVELPEAGKQLKAGDAIGDIESVKAVSQIYAPVSGEVVEVNQALVTQPETVNTSPLAEGWMVRIRLSNPDETAGLMSLAQYEKHIAEHP
jgi:glycine cleavage system H protein